MSRAFTVQEVQRTHHRTVLGTLRAPTIFPPSQVEIFANLVLTAKTLLVWEQTASPVSIYHSRVPSQTHNVSLALKVSTAQPRVWVRLMEIAMLDTFALKVQPLQLSRGAPMIITVLKVPFPKFHAHQESLLTPLARPHAILALLVTIAEERPL